MTPTHPPPEASELDERTLAELERRARVATPTLGSTMQVRTTTLNLLIAAARSHAEMAAEVEGLNCALEDEEAGHLETLDELKAAHKRVAELEGMRWRAILTVMKGSTFDILRELGIDIPPGGVGYEWDDLRDLCETKILALAKAAGGKAK